MSAATGEVFDVTARKVHQFACVALLIVGFIVGSGAGPWLVVLVGLVLLAGRFWWPADVFRQLTWRVLEPFGLVKRRDAQEDHGTRRVARVLGGVVLLVASVLVGVGASWGWVLIGLIGLMIFLDAALDFCALCFLAYRFDRLTARA